MIQEFINALALTNEKYWFYYDMDTKTIVKNRSTVDGMDATYLAHAYPERFLPLPNKKQIHTYAIMEEYAKTAPQLDKKGREKLHTALQGAGPFKRFKDEARKLGVEEDWLRYRDKRFEQMTREWCAEHRIELSETIGSSPTIDGTFTAQQIVANIAAMIPDTNGMAIALIESIRILFHMLDDAGFEAALDELVAGLKRDP